MNTKANNAIAMETNLPRSVMVGAAGCETYETREKRSRPLSAKDALREYSSAKSTPSNYRESVKSRRSLLDQQRLDPSHGGAEVVMRLQSTGRQRHAGLQIPGVSIPQ